MWKVYEIDSGSILKAGFDNEEEARAWLENKFDDLEGLYNFELMDEEEAEEWQEAQDKLKQDEEFYIEIDELEAYEQRVSENDHLPDELEGADLSIAHQDDL